MGLFRILLIMLAMLTGSYCSTDTKQSADNSAAVAKKKKKKKRKKRVSDQTNDDDSGSDDDSGDDDDDDDDDDEEVDYTKDLDDDEKEIFELFSANVAESVVGACVGCHESATAIDGDNLDKKNNVKNWEVLQPIVTKATGINCSSGDFITFLEDSNVHGGAAKYLEGSTQLEAADIDKWLEVEPVCIAKKAAEDEEAAAALAFVNVMATAIDANNGNCASCHAGTQIGNANLAAGDSVINRATFKAFAVDPNGIDCVAATLFTTITVNGNHNAGVTGPFTMAVADAAALDLWLSKEPECIAKVAAAQ